jgi:anti-sigma regulatory factor (Ser/Thr protein kinase)
LEPRPSPENAVAAPLLRRAATADAVPAARAATVAFARAASAPPDIVSAIGLAVTEACTNAVVHAYADAPAPGNVEIHAGVHDGELTVMVADEGRGMQPRPDSPGLGMGLAIIAQLADRLEILDTPERLGVAVLMYFRLST